MTSKHTYRAPKAKWERGQEKYLFQDWNSTREDKYGENDEFLEEESFITECFMKEWGVRTPLYPAPWDAHIADSLLQNFVFDDFYVLIFERQGPNELQDSTQRLHLWKLLREWEYTIPHVRSFLEGFSLPAHRCSQLFLIDYLVYHTKDLYDEGTSFALFKALLDADDLTVETMTKAALNFHLIKDYPAGWWPPFLAALEDCDWKGFWHANCPSKSEKLKSFARTLKSYRVVFTDHLEVSGPAFSRP